MPHRGRSSAAGRPWGGGGGARRWRRSACTGERRGEGEVAARVFGMYVLHKSPFIFVFSERDPIFGFFSIQIGFSWLQRA